MVINLGHDSDATDAGDDKEVLPEVCFLVYTPHQSHNQMDRSRRSIRDFFSIFLKVPNESPPAWCSEEDPESVGSSSGSSSLLEKKHKRLKSGKFN